MTGNRFLGIFFIAFGVLSYFVLIPKGIVVPENIQHASTSPSFWPKIITLIIAFMGILLMLPETVKEQDDENEDEERTPWKTRIPRLLIIFGHAICFLFFY